VVTDRSLSPPEGDAAPGWYPDARGTPRWWNGQRWTLDEPDDGTPAPAGTDARRVPRVLAIVALSVSGIGTIAAVTSVIARFLCSR
jgi:hypothetical protein